VALAHHWLVAMRGGEKVLEQICRLFPGAPIHTLVARLEKLSGQLQSHPIHTSWLQRIPGGSRHYKKLLPLFPTAVSSLRIEGDYELILSSDASLIKGLQYPSQSLHVCYCHSPPRYLWDMMEEYQNSAEMGGMAGRALFNSIAPMVRDFDLQAAKKVDHFIANSQFVRERIARYYKREAMVIHPPVDIDSFSLAENEPEDFYLVVSQLVPYKRIELAVQAFTKLKKRLIVIGEGSERPRLEKIAGPTIQFLGHQPFQTVRDYFRRCRALVFPGIEDFGITLLEAQACGRAVVAFRKGGALETIRERVTGLFFDEPSTDALASAIEALELNPLNPMECRSNAEGFGPDRFRRQLSGFLTQVLRGNQPPAETVPLN
jgi:glycosyltransferase involved in cell wall biosynthesis